ncbi:MAG: efflux RND transporter periplasmic adaptor subunit [Woeseiaceae bacterium]|jgi:Cu(I)/Ag(I) efflux system membrane fusion protein|nr:efflux RND transporter periplasmic adaptor subunit [Woeseiaceae bacterium]
MQKAIGMIIVIVAALAAGAFFGSTLDLRGRTGETPAADAEREILYWVAPMDPNFRRDAPGKSPMGMDLVPVYADEVDARPGVVSIDPVVRNNMGVRTAPAERSSLPRLIETTAHVAYDEETVVHIHTRVDAWIERLEATAEGDVVSSGDLLFEMYSPTLVNAQQEYLTALGSGSSALRSASRDRLLSLGMPTDEIDRLDRERRVKQRVEVHARSDGVIADLGVREGMFVTPNTEVLAIAKLDTVWVFADVLERQADWVRPGQAARIEFEAFPGLSFESRVDYVYPELDPVTRTLRVRIRLDNEAVRLRPNMFGRVRIAGRATGDVVHVPREAVIRSGHGNRVVIDLGGGRFEAREVMLGVESGDRIAIRRGVRAGESVVVSAQFLIDSESAVGSSLARLQGDRAAERGADIDAGESPGAEEEPVEEPVMDQGDMDHGDMDHSEMDHSAMDHAGGGDS